MVILVDLDEEVDDPFVDGTRGNGWVNLKSDVWQYSEARHAAKLVTPWNDDQRPNPNINSFSAALACYPIASEVVRFLDQVSLHSLVCTCRQIRANLFPYRRHLVGRTLRCENEDLRMGPRLADHMTESIRTWNVYSNDGARNGRISSGRVGKCARDLVGGCRRCGRIVCRNCTAKPPSRGASSGRHRRLCKACTEEPLRQHIRSISLDADGLKDDFADKAFAQEPCSCPDAIWLCRPCGHATQSADTTYMRGWTWRTRYSTYLGGLGAGIGEGNEGVECGRGSRCLAAREVEKEIDCDAEELAEWKREMDKAEREGRKWGGTSYFTQEMEGIGGIVKKKAKKRLKLGAVVREHEDERDNGEYLWRERKGYTRSWCAWCTRVIPSAKDVDG